MSAVGRSSVSQLFHRDIHPLPAECAFSRGYRVDFAIIVFSFAWMPSLFAVSSLVSRDALIGTAG